MVAVVAPGYRPAALAPAVGEAGAVLPRLGFPLLAT
jgi:hypothetical protein